MVALRQVEIPFYRGVGRQRGRGFGAIAQSIGRTAIAFVRKYIIPAAKRVAADLLEFAAPEIAEVVSGRKSFKTAAKSVGGQTLRQQLGSGSKKRTASRVIPTKSAKQMVDREETFLPTFLINHVKQFSVPNSCRSFCESWRGKFQ